MTNNDDREKKKQNQLELTAIMATLFWAPIGGYFAKYPTRLPIRLPNSQL